MDNPSSRAIRILLRRKTTVGVLVAELEAQGFKEDKNSVKGWLRRKTYTGEVVKMGTDGRRATYVLSSYSAEGSASPRAPTWLQPTAVPLRWGSRKFVDGLAKPVTDTRKKNKKNKEVHDGIRCEQGQSPQTEGDS